MATEAENREDGGAPRSEAESAGGGGPVPGDPSGAGSEDLVELRKRAEERDAYRSELQRARADFDNLQKRTRKERAGWEDQAVRRFVKDLLPVLDNFERALASMPEAGSQGPLEEGIRLTHQMMRRVLEDNAVSEIPARGEMFDPELHEAVAEEPVEDRPTGEIVDVLQKGYRHGDALLRPSRVKVARNVKERETTSHADV
jgi:molecular chaperone GrpE